MSTKKNTSKAAKASKTTKATRTKANKTPTQKDHPRDPRLPAVGSKLTRQFKGKEIVVEVVEGGFQFEGQTFGSISACARHICGYGISGPHFFRMAMPKPGKLTGGK